MDAPFEKNWPRLGTLERAALERLWTHGSADVKSVHADVGAPRGISSNTVHSALERLVRKGLAQRSKHGRAYAYRAAVSRREWLRRGLADVAGGMPGADANALLAAFVDLAERAGEEHLAELANLVRERRRRARGGAP